MKLSIILPVYEEKATVTTVLDQLLALQIPDVEKEILVVEGASKDGTREIVRSYEVHPEIRVVYEEKPQGKGAAVRAGLALASGDIIVIQDGDLEYKISDYPRLLQPLLRGEADVVFGSRAMEGWQYRKFEGLEKLYGFAVNAGGLAYTTLFNVLYGTKLTDGATMFKIYRAEVLRGLTLRSHGFDYDWEMAAKVAKRGYAIKELPIEYKARSRAEGKKIRFVRDGVRVLKAIVRYRFSD